MLPSFRLPVSHEKELELFAVVAQGVNEILIGSEKAGANRDKQNGKPPNYSNELGHLLVYVETASAACAKSEPRRRKQNHAPASD